jgi:hypothetical protein
MAYRREVAISSFGRPISDVKLSSKKPQFSGNKPLFRTFTYKETIHILYRWKLFRGAYG